MKKILIKFMIVVSPILLIAYPLDMLLSRLLKNVDAEYVGEIQIWNKIYEGKFNYDLYIYGSSRAINHIDPQYITKKTGLSAYNIGMDGQHFMMEEFRHRQLLKYNKKPQYIILGLDDTSLIKTDGLYLKEQLLPYMLWNSDIEEILSEFEGYGKYDCQIPLIRYVGDYKTLGYITSTFLKKTRK